MFAFVIACVATVLMYFALRHIGQLNAENRELKDSITIYQNVAQEGTQKVFAAQYAAIEAKHEVAVIRSKSIVVDEYNPLYVDQLDYISFSVFERQGMYGTSEMVHNKLKNFYKNRPADVHVVKLNEDWTAAWRGSPMQPPYGLQNIYQNMRLQEQQYAQSF